MTYYLCEAQPVQAKEVISTFSSCWLSNNNYVEMTGHNNTIVFNNV